MTYRCLNYSKKQWSHRSRGAWIEIGWSACICLYWSSVASLTRCVDWNVAWTVSLLWYISRIAHAVRGLKSDILTLKNMTNCRIAHAVRGLKFRSLTPRDNPDNVASLTRCVDWNHRITLSQLLPNGRIAHAVRGLKCLHINSLMDVRRITQMISLS